jgi:hypothetical protein
MERGWAALPEELQQEPQLLLGLNLGLTCPEYRWGPALAAAERYARGRLEGCAGAHAAAEHGVPSAAALLRARAGAVEHGLQSFGQTSAGAGGGLATDC